MRWIYISIINRRIKNGVKLLNSQASNGDTAHGFTYNSSKGVWDNLDATVGDNALQVVKKW